MHYIKRFHFLVCNDGCSYFLSSSSLTFFFVRAPPFYHLSVCRITINYCKEKELVFPFHCLKMKSFKSFQHRKPLYFIYTSILYTAAAVLQNFKLFFCNFTFLNKQIYACLYYSLYNIQSFTVILFAQRNILKP